MEIRKCLICHQEYHPLAINQKYCGYCHEYRMDEIRARWDCSSKFKDPEEPKPKKKIKTISDIIKEVRAYNESHDTNLSYGQYVKMMDHGELKGE